MADSSYIKRIGPAGFRRAILFGVVGAFLMGFMVVNTITSNNLGSNSIKLGKEGFSDDADLVVSAKQIYKLTSADAGPPVGEGAPGGESTSALPRINNALVKNKWAYEFEVKEAAVDSLQSGENFKIEVYMDDGSTSPIATLYMKQDTVDDGSVEGVTVTANTGSANVVGDLFSIIITRQ